MSLQEAGLTHQVQAKTVLTTKGSWSRTNGAPEWTSTGAFLAENFLEELIPPGAHFQQLCLGRLSAIQEREELRLTETARLDLFQVICRTGWSTSSSRAASSGYSSGKRDGGVGVGSEGRRSCVILIMAEVTRPLLFRDLVVVFVLTASSGGAPRMVNNLFLAVDALGMMGGRSRVTDLRPPGHDFRRR